MTDPILIVGAGPTGLTLAIELARRAVPFYLIDQRLEPRHSDRAAFVKSRSLEIFANYGLADSFLCSGQVINGFDIFSNGIRTAWFRLHELDSPFPFFLGISESRTEEILTEKLERLGGRIERGVSFDGLAEESGALRVHLRLGADAQERKVSWLVAADGSHSAVREAVGIDFTGHDYPLNWGVIDGRVSNWHQPEDIVASHFDPVIYAAPIGEGRRRIYFRADQTGDSSHAYIERQLASIKTGVRLIEAEKAQLFHAHCRIAARFRVGRVLLAGDAAHAISPTQAHGMNTGIQDAFNIGWKLALVVQGLAREELLDSYESERRPVAELVGTSGDVVEALIDKGDPDATDAIRAALATDSSRRQVATDEAEIAYRYCESPIVVDLSPLPGSPPVTKVGCRVGDAGPLVGQGGELRVHQMLTHGGYTLFLLVKDADSAVLKDAIVHAGRVAERYGALVKAYVVATEIDGVDDEIDPPLLLDKDGVLHARLCGDTPCLCLVRPDGHLGLRVTPPSMSALEGHLSQILL